MVLTPHFEYLAMQVQHFRGACTLVQVVYVLGNDVYVEMLFQFGQQLVGCVWLCFPHIGAAHIVEVEHQLRVAAPGTRRSHILDVISFPKAIAVAEGSQPALSADTCAGQYNEFLFGGVHGDSIIKRVASFPSGASAYRRSSYRGRTHASSPSVRGQPYRLCSAASRPLSAVGNRAHSRW